MGRRNKNGRSLEASYGKSVKDSESGSKGGYIPVLDFSSLEKEERPKFYKIKEGKNVIDIIPHVISTKYHDLVVSNLSEVGGDAHVLNVNVHRNCVGPNNDSIVCLKQYGKSCPICEEQTALLEKGETELAKNMKAKQRVFYVIKDVLDPDSGFQIFEISKYWFENEIAILAQEQGDGRYIPFADPERGKNIGFKGIKKSFNGKDFLEPKGFYFKDRKELYDEDIADEVWSLDKYLNILSYEKIQSILFGVPSDEEKDDEVHEEKSKRRKRHKEPEEYNEEEEEEDETVRKSKKVDCPDGFTFGTDFEAYEECDSCPSKIWDACEKANIELRRKKR